MADISLVEDDTSDGSYEEVVHYRTRPTIRSEPIQIINANADIFNRYTKLGEALMYGRNKMVAFALRDLFEEAPADVFAQDLTELMDEVIKAIMANGKPIVTRLDFLEEIPYIAAIAAKCTTRVPDLSRLLSDHLLPVLFQNLSHRDNTVKRVAQYSLFSLMEENLVTPEQIEKLVCPAILELTDSETLSSYNTGYITLMSQFALFLGREITERVFLGGFSKLCLSTNFCVRKVCVSHIGDFCAVVGKEAYDNVLLPTYIRLCSDEVWGVRKSCAEVIMYVSCACTPAKRQYSLAPVFAKLLQDQNRWVRMSAFRTLGPFISTFADPYVTTLAFNNLGELVLMNKDGSVFRVAQTLPFLKIKKDDLILFPEDTDLECSLEDLLGPIIKKDSHIKNAEEIVSLTDLFDNENINNTDAAGGDKIMVFESQNGDVKENLKPTDEIQNLERKEGVENLEDYNSYKYWYVSPEMPLDPSIVNNKATPTNRKPVLQGDNCLCNGTDSRVSNLRTPTKCFLPELELIRTPTLDVKEDLEVTKFQQLDVRESFGTSSQLEVPKMLIDHFVSMTNSTLADETDTEMAFHCAYSLPAVTLTLGSKNWHLIQRTVEILAANMQYKVRRTVACSLHELATILGQDIATNDLTPIFEGFIKDLDEVRIGVLKHLAHFLKLINPSKRNMYLPWLESFLQTDNKANWRFRQELAEQLLLVVPLFRPGDLSKHISFLAQELLCDKVAAVREVALLLVTKIIQQVSSDQTRTSRLLVKLAEKFAHSIQWKLRQLFALLCSELLTSRALIPEQFACEVMPHLLDLSWDPVPNVRLVVARTIAQHIVTDDYFADASNQHYDSLQSVLRRLQSDKDRDVRQSASFEKVTNVE